MEIEMVRSDLVARAAIISCAAGWIILSLLEIWYHVGNCRQAGGP